MSASINRFGFLIVLGSLLLCLGRLLGAAPASTQPDIPGSATMPPKTVDAPLPAPLASAKDSVGAKLGVWIKPDGTVDTVDVIAASAEWRDSVVAAVKRWRFEPVMAEGKPIAARTEVEIVQAGPKEVRSTVTPLPNLPGEVHNEDEFGLTRPMLKVDPDIILPLMVRVNGREIVAVVKYAIQEDGLTDKIEVQEASSEGAVRSALDLIAGRKYQPAKIREQPVIIAYRQVLGFTSSDPRIDALSGAVDVVDPAYPYERLLAEEEGNATVRFTLDAKGRVKSTELVETSHADFGAALIAAVESWSFSADAAAAQNVREYRHDFTLAKVPYAARRLMAELREGKKTPSSSAGLDARPKAAARPALAYPTSLLGQSVSGTAKIEFVIDRVGLAQVPRVVEASRPEFGWAAVTLVNGMRFDPLTRGGKPTELRVIFPITFEPPKAAEPAAAVAK
jgi:TonB family protein